MTLTGNLLKDIVHLPFLIAHYLHHNHSEGHIHFGDFISLHYSHNQHHKKGHNGHNNLPFHHHDSNSLQNNQSPVIAETWITQIAEYKTDNDKNKMITGQEFHSSSALSAIWKPPKTAC